MKKLIAILSSMMMITTASLPIIACHTKQKETKFENNNSITNAQTTASLFAKELILADQLKVNLEEIKKEYNNKSLTDLLKDNNLKLDNTDSSISDVKTLNDLVDKYFEKDSYKSGLDSKIKLDSETKKPSIPLFSEIFKLIGLGTTDLDKYSDDILKILELTTSLNPAFLVTGFDSVNSTLKSSFEKVKPYLKEGLEKLSNPKVDFTKDVEEFQNKIDVNKNYKELKAEDLDNAFYTSIVNAVGLSEVGARYTPVKIKTENASKSLKEAAEALSKALNGPGQPATGKELEIVGYILEAIQFLQIKLSLFENARDYTPKAPNNIFDATKTNQQFLIELYKDKNIEKIVADKKSSINLKYIFSFFKKALDELKDETKKDGFELQKLLNILFLSQNKVEYPETSTPDNAKDYYEKNSAHPVVTVLTVLVNDFLNKKVKLILPLIGGSTKEDELKKVISDSLPHLYKWMGYTLNNLLTGTKNLHDSLSTLFVKVIPAILTSLQKNTKLIPDSYKDKIQLLPFLLAVLIDEVLSVAFPILKKDDKNTNSFKDLYSGEVFLVNKVNAMFKKFRETIDGILKNVGQDSRSIPFSTIRGFLTTLENGYDKIFKNVKEFNLKGLLTTPLNKIDEASWKDRKALKPLQSKSVADILDTILTGLDVKGNEKLAELTSSNINLTGLTDLAKVMDKYEYKPNGFDYKGKTHLLEILKENQDKTLEIIGWTSDKNNPIGKDSLLDTVLNKVFNVDTSKKDDKSENAVNQISKIITTLNNSLDKLIIDESSVEIKFEFKDTKKNKSDQLLSETLVAKVKNKNDKSESTYSFSYLRDKQDKFKFTKITKN
ncbi:MOLPALP family lipoprotein [Mycoplasma feriruminatoris]|uniref:MOLPALP family lipoprotein n=1 Tax=Mycoplasma feriruminatoris TaxID=1179777 RepID=UPI0002A51954|nr:MOLPALP family lipoprotein [Mycoplasma feriruminatoris]UKS53980.1 putative lipoprotein [Mycoplasma feriruminatoris]UKS54001.1 putative lipoprotein [Mycoplasma feriruminatoris]